jgi:NAD(P)-dependent dehydrogenase (short-subunit alcohol dehydrogenase family)
MLRKKSGASCNISSVVGSTGNRPDPYTMVKAGLDAFAKSLAQGLLGRDMHPRQLGGGARGFASTPR